MFLTEMKHDFLLVRGRKRVGIIQIKEFILLSSMLVFVCLSGSPLNHKALTILLL